MPEIELTEPSEIFAAIQARSPLMHAQTRAAYIGKEVDWTLLAADGYEEAPGNARVMFHYRPHEVKYVAVRVPTADYPWLKSMRAGEAVQVRGRIAEIGNLNIELTEATLMQLVESAR